LPAKGGAEPPLYPLSARAGATAAAPFFDQWILLQHGFGFVVFNVDYSADGRLAELPIPGG
jgi:hypothetical protein